MTPTSAATRISAPGSISGASVLLGVGMGGFVDGILLHQILQWHHMLSTTDSYRPTTMENMETNMLADGLFHAATWLFVAAGLGLLWRSARRGGAVWGWRSLIGWMAVGWGGFNLVEGLVNHHLLEIHRVRPDARGAWIYDLAFLGFGVLLVTAGWVLQQTDPARRPNAPPTDRN